MATTQPKNGAPPIDAAFEHAKELNAQFLTTARKAGNVYLDSYEKAVDRTIELELEFAGLTQQEWLKNLIEAQAELAREVADSYTTAARGLLEVAVL